MSIKGHAKPTRHKRLVDCGPTRAHPEESFGVLMPQIAAATCGLHISQQVIAREAALFEDGVPANFDALIALGDLAAAPPLADFIDASRLAEASKQ
jgi:hypothetical protein